MSFLTLLGALLIGLTLGLTGAGGSIITLPVLVYLGGIHPLEAVPLSLLIVGVAALTGGIRRLPKGEICLPTAAIFSVTGMIGATFGARLTPLISAKTLMVIFAILMIIVAVQMLRPERKIDQSTADAQTWMRKASAGLAVGVLTGFIGVGGGFLLVPALIQFGGLPLRKAVGSSLAIIFFNCVAGFLSHLGENPTNWTIAGVYSGLACAGVVVGTALAAKVPTRQLRQGFAVMVIVTGGLVLWQSLSA